MTDQNHSQINNDRQALRSLAQRLSARSTATASVSTAQNNLDQSDASSTAQAASASAANAQASQEASNQPQSAAAAYNDSVHAREFKLLSPESQAKLQGCFERNMAAFFKYYPEIYKKLCFYRPQRDIEFVITKSGTPDLLFADDHEYFYKTDDPFKLCQNQVASALRDNAVNCAFFEGGVDLLGQLHCRYFKEMVDYQDQHGVSRYYMPKLGDSCPLALILGVGLGYHLGILYEKVAFANLIIIEPDLDLFYASLYTFDWANLLELAIKGNRGICILAGHTREQIYDAINNYYKRHGLMLANMTWNMIHYRSKTLTEVVEQIRIDYDRYLVSLGFLDDSLFCISHGSYLLTHHARFLRNDVPLPEEIANIPVCVVANGPSLSADLPFLRKVQDKVIIIACGTALETLYHAGIKPLFYTAIERVRSVAESIKLIPDQEFVQDVYMIAADTCHPDTFNLFKRAAFVFKSDEVFFPMAGIKYMELFKQAQAASLISPLVGNMGLSAASFLGFKNIYLFGIDNGTKIKDQLHPKECMLYQNIWERFEHSYNDLREQNGNKVKSMFELTFTLPGNFGGDVYSAFAYNVALRCMEIVIEGHSELKYYNCSDGAKITGAKPLHSQELLESWLQRPDIDPEPIKDFMDEKKTMDFNFTDADIENILDRPSFNHLVDVIHDEIAAIEPPKSRLDFVLVLEHICELLYSYRNHQFDFAVSLISGSINQMFIMINRVLYLTEDEQEAIKRGMHHLKLVCYFLEDAKKFYEFVPRYYAENHHEFLKDKLGFDHPGSPAPSYHRRELLVTQEDQDKYPVRKFVKRYE